MPRFPSARHLQREAQHRDTGSSVRVLPPRDPRDCDHDRNHSHNRHRDGDDRDRRSSRVRGDHDACVYPVRRNNHACVHDDRVHRNTNVPRDEHDGRARRNRCARVHAYHDRSHKNVRRGARANAHNRKRNAQQVRGDGYGGDARARDYSHMYFRDGVRGGRDRRSTHARGDGARACARRACNRSCNFSEYYFRSYRLPLKAFHNMFECHGKNFPNVRIVQRVVHHSPLFAAFYNVRNF